MNESGSDYFSPQFKGKLVIIALAVGILVDLVSVWSGWMEIGLLERIAIGSFTEAEAEANDLRQSMIGIGQIAVYAATVVLFLFWIHRAHKNLAALGASDLKYTPGWAVGWWFIPFLNLVRPFQVVGEIWRAGGPSSTDELSWKNAPGSPLLGVWWFFWLVANFAGQISFRLASRAETIDSILTADYAILAADASSVVAAVLCLLVVKEITRRQDEKHKVATTLGFKFAVDSNGAPPPLPVGAGR
jgi:hypothetical protein